MRSKRTHTNSGARVARQPAVMFVAASETADRIADTPRQNGNPGLMSGVMLLSLNRVAGYDRDYHDNVSQTSWLTTSDGSSQSKPRNVEPLTTRGGSSQESKPIQQKQVRRCQAAKHNGRSETAS